MDYGELTAWVRTVANWADEEFAEKRAELDAAIAEHEARAEPQAPVAPAPPEPAQPPKASVEPVRLDEFHPKAAPPVVAIPVGDHLEGERGWHALYRSDDPWWHPR